MKKKTRKIRKQVNTAVSLICALKDLQVFAAVFILDNIDY